MSGGDLSADARLALRHDRVGKADHVHAPRQHGVSEFGSQGGIAQHDRHDRVGAWQNREAELGHFLPEKSGVRFKFVAQGGRFAQHFQHFERCADNWRGDSVRKEIGPRTLAQVFNDLLATTRVTAAGPSQRLPQGAGQDVHPPHDLVEFMGAAARFAHEPDRVRIIDHHQRVIFFS